MAVEAHLQSLSRRHQELETALAAERKKPQFDETLVHELKRLKLRIKDQIADIERRTHTEGSAPNGRG